MSNQELKPLPPPLKKKSTPTSKPSSSHNTPHQVSKPATSTGSSSPVEVVVVADHVDSNTNNPVVPVGTGASTDDTAIASASRSSTYSNGTPKPAEKEGSTWGRLQRMFSAHSKDLVPKTHQNPADHPANLANPSNPSNPSKSRAPTPVPQGDRTPGRQSPEGPVASQKPALDRKQTATAVAATAMTATTATATATASDKQVAPAPEKHAPEKQAPEKTTIEKQPTSSSLTPSTASSSKATAKLTVKDMPRFAQDSSLSGGHEHHLKSSRRQEKLSNKFKSLLGKKPDTAEFDDLSLVSDWVDAAMKRDKDEAAVDKKGGPNDTKSLVEKYGKCHEVVGRGAFGIVRVSHKKQDNGERLFAVKEFRRRPKETEKRYSKRLMDEYNIGISLLHPNICRTLDLAYDDKGDLCEVMEYCAGGDLYTLVLAAGKLESQEADCFFKQMMRGVQYLHEMGVAHRDLKPENLLLTTRGALKITDFGNGECFRNASETEPRMVSGLCGSAPYIAPEEYTEKEFDGRAVDLWACGVIYMAMRTGRHLWNVAKKDEDDFYKKYLEGRKREDGYVPIETLQRARCRNVIYSVLDPSATRRLTAAQVLKSEWVREIKLCRAGEEGL